MIEVTITFMYRFVFMLPSESILTPIAFKSVLNLLFWFADLIKFNGQ